MVVFDLERMIEPMSVYRLGSSGTDSADRPLNSGFSSSTYTAGDVPWESARRRQSAGRYQRV